MAKSSGNNDDEKTRVEYRDKKIELIIEISTKIYDEHLKQSDDNQQLKSELKFLNKTLEDCVL